MDERQPMTVDLVRALLEAAGASVTVRPKLYELQKLTGDL